MLANQHDSRTVESTLGGETVQMGVQVENMPHIMNMLINQYTDQELASIREYVTNAWDEHVKLGLDRPIEVSLPSRLSPFLRIKDYGVGMDSDAIRRVYSQYGSSTKRDSNDFNGMFGIGGKAALSYTDQFTVVSTKNGRTIQVSVSRAANGAGFMQIVSDKETDKPSGTEIIIPAKLPNQFGEKAAHLFGFWAPGTVVVDGQPPKQHEHLSLTDNVWLIDGDQSYIVMGNVPYKARIKHDLPRGYDYAARRPREEKSVAVFVPIGAVDIPPSREEIVATDHKTKQEIRAIEGTIERAKSGAVQREINAATTPAEAVQTMLRWTKALGLPNDEGGYYRYNGIDMPSSYEPTKKLAVTVNSGQLETGMLLSDNSTKKLAKADRRKNLPVGMWEGTLLAHGYDRKGMTATQKRKLIQYVSENKLEGVKRFALVAEKPPAEIAKWIGASRIIKWADVNALKLPSTAAASNGWSGRLPGSYDVFESNFWKEGIAGDKIDRSYPIFYVHGNYSAGCRFAAMLTKYIPKNYVVCLSANRIDKFCRIVPSAKTARQGVKDIWKQRAAKLTADERLALHIHEQGQREMLAALAPVLVNDPALREAIRLSKVDIKRATTLQAEFARIIDTDLPDAVQWSNPLDSYPLYTAMWSGSGYYTRTERTSDDMYLYLNAKFAQASTTTKKGA